MSGLNVQAGLSYQAQADADCLNNSGGFKELRQVNAKHLFLFWDEMIAACLMKSKLLNHPTLS